MGSVVMDLGEGVLEAEGAVAVVLVWSISSSGPLESEPFYMSGDSLRMKN